VTKSQYVFPKYSSLIDPMIIVVLSLETESSSYMVYALMATVSVDPISMKSLSGSRPMPILTGSCEHDSNAAVSRTERVSMSEGAPLRVLPGLLFCRFQKEFVIKVIVCIYIILLSLVLKQRLSHGSDPFLYLFVNLLD